MYKERLEMLCIALESKNFKQCQGALHRKVGRQCLLEDSDSDCCIGVAEKLMPTDKRKSSLDETIGHKLDSKSKISENYAAIIGFFGITHSELHDLINLNDQGADFLAIASHIRTNIKDKKDV